MPYILPGLVLAGDIESPLQTLSVAMREDWFSERDDDDEMGAAGVTVIHAIRHGSRDTSPERLRWWLYVMDLQFFF